jgi:Fe-S cluster assembly protein SufD
MADHTPLSPFLIRKNMQASESKELYLSEFKRYRDDGAAKNPIWLRQLRESAIESFRELGFPTTHDEDWKYTNLDSLTSVPFHHGNGLVKNLTANEVFALALADAESQRMVFINGRYSPELSSLRRLPAGVRVESIAAALSKDDGLLERHLGRYTRIREQPFVALNTALTEDGALVVVPKNCKLPEPIHLIFVSVVNGGAVAYHPRNLMIAEGGAEAQIVETYIGLGTGNYFVNPVSEVVGEEDAVIDHHRLQRESIRGFHIGALEARLNRSSNITAHAITLGGGLVRNDVHAVLAGEGSECVLNGLYVLDGKQHVDNSTEIEHTKPKATSLELYKGILGGSARGVFNGKILVHKDAQKTNARQTNKNLLLSADAVVNTKPQLEIYADDVKCSHGSTIGQLDRDALFYLRSRGLGREEAQSLLSYAFASEVVGKIKVDYLRQKLNDYLLNKFSRNSESKIQ